jgi:hypothetical protein
MPSNKCAFNKQISCESILEGEFTTINGTKFTATMSATGSGNTCESAKENSIININKTLDNFLNTYKPKIIKETHKITTTCDSDCEINAPLPKYPDTKNSSSVVYYNTNSLVVDGLYNDVSAWQGIRYLGENIYLMAGSTVPNDEGDYDGLIFTGNINCINGISYTLNVPNPNGGFYTTSNYGPDYDINTGIYRFVGSYIAENGNTNGFIYSGNLSEESLTNPDNFQFNSISDKFNFTYFHSISGNFLVGNSFNSDTGLSISYLINVTKPNSKPIPIQYPNAVITTSYGIWHNGDNTYIIIGGWGLLKENINPYTNFFIYPYAGGFIVNYNSNTNTFSNWTNVTLPELGDVFTHLQGVERIGDTNTYSIAADAANKKLTKSDGYYVTINRDPATGEFSVNNNWIKIDYNLTLEKGYTTANSVSNNVIVGIIISKDIIPYQALVESETDISLTNNYSQTLIAKNEKIKFDKRILSSNITYDTDTSIFTFIYDGLYLINLNIYLQNLKLPAALFTIYYTVDKKEYNFTISQKGMDEDKKGTIHGLSLPCSFSSNFYSGDIFYVKNTSDGTIVLSSNYIKNSIGSLISITKLN